MLVPTGLTKKEREAYDKKNARTVSSKVNIGPRAGLRPPGGDKEKKSGTKTFTKR